MKTWTCLALVLVTATFEALAASFQPSLDKAGNAVGGTVTGRQWHEHKLTSRAQWQDCLQKYMSNQKHDAGAPQDPCFSDTGAGSALSLLAGRTLLQNADAIPNYAASASTPAAGSGAAGVNNVNAVASSKPPPNSAVNQNPFAGGNQASASKTPTNAAAAGNTPAEETSSNGIATSKVIPEQVVAKKPQPVGPDPRDFQQTKDFPPGTRLSRDQAALLLSGRGFHHGR